MEARFLTLIGQVAFLVEIMLFKPYRLEPPNDWWLLELCGACLDTACISDGSCHCPQFGTDLIRILLINQLFILMFEDTMRAYIQQLRQEMGVRICDKVFDPETDKPSKVCAFSIYILH